MTEAGKEKRGLNEEELRRKIKQLFTQSVPRYYEHTLSVVENMRRLMEGISDPQERMLLIASAYLHDIGYSERYGSDFVGNIPDQKIKMKVHSEEGARIAERILGELGMEKEFIRQVAYLVSVHHREDISDRHLNLLLKADRAS